MEKQDLGRTEIASIGEFGLIEHLTKNFEIQNESSHYGIGDDAAVIDNTGFLTVVSTDLLVEGVHFDLRWTSPDVADFEAVYEFPAVNGKKFYEFRHYTLRMGERLTRITSRITQTPGGPRNASAGAYLGANSNARCNASFASSICPKLNSNSATRAHANPKFGDFQANFAGLIRR